MSKYIELYSAVLNFYSLQAVEVIAHTQADPFRHSHDRWLRDFADVSRCFTEALAHAMFDYLALAAFGEARHSAVRALRTIEGLPRSGCSRESAMHLARDYDPRNFLPKLETLFENTEWEDGYGGEAWAKIVRAAMQYGKLPDAAFIDHCVDLSHNGGLCFDKCEAQIFLLSGSKHSYYTLLNDKRDNTPAAFLDEYMCTWGVSHTVRALAIRALNLGLLPPSIRVYTDHRECNEYDAEDVEASDVVAVALHYSPIQWGNKRLGRFMNSNYTICSDCGETYKSDEFIYVEGAPVCGCCYDGGDYYECAHCNEHFQGDHVVHVCNDDWDEPVFLCYVCYVAHGELYKQKYGEGGEGGGDDENVVEQGEKTKKGGKGKKENGFKFEYEVVPVEEYSSLCNIR